MAVKLKMTAIFVFTCLVLTVHCCDVNDMAIYKVNMKMLWSEETFPKDYPMNRPKAQWSPTFGQSHNATYSLYRVGEVARPTVRGFAQFGKIDDLVKEGEEDPRVYDQFSTPALGKGVGETDNLVLVDGEHTLVSLISHMIPSPDWYVGVDSVNLCVDSTWLDQITLDLEPLDAGAASGLTFTAPRWETVPPEAVTRHKPKKPDHPSAGFYYPELRELPTIAKVQFTKVKEYTTKDLNNLARDEMLKRLKSKDQYKGYSNKIKRDRIEKNTYTDVKEDLDVLKSLEEEPVGTPVPNQPDNEVIVVTEAPIVTSTAEKEFDKELNSMDDVVLAVAKGRKLGLGRHLPRHFRSRLHHAVNRIQPDDCLVSEWSDWTPCSTTCGFGDKYRSRKVVRAKRGDGRNCPPLVDREHCGNVNSCTHMDYFEW